MVGSARPDSLWRASTDLSEDEPCLRFHGSAHPSAVARCPAHGRPQTFPERASGTLAAGPDLGPAAAPAWECFLFCCAHSVPERPRPDGSCHGRVFRGPHFCPGVGSRPRLSKPSRRHSDAEGKPLSSSPRLAGRGPRRAGSRGSRHFLLPCLAAGPAVSPALRSRTARQPAPRFTTGVVFRGVASFLFCNCFSRRADGENRVTE